MPDFSWINGGGGLLLDGSGDIAVASGYPELLSMVLTRLQATTEGWALYPLIGANLGEIPGSIPSPELISVLTRNITSCLTSDNLITPGNVTVNTQVIGDILELYIYISATLVSVISYNPKTNSSQVNLL